MAIAAETIVEMEFDDVGDEVNEAIREVLIHKGIEMVGITIEVAHANSEWRNIRELRLRIKGSHDVE